MVDFSFLGLKLLSPKMVGAMLCGAPLTVTIGPALGLVVLGAMGGACAFSYASATNTLANKKGQDNTVATPPL
ncbi:hypothetical protein [Magnetospirillum sp. UT-4]|uniref:hypothetical protein n=1 Tax=Magnetospirillum sp. UT-4 TaxID=2681467 RepID=UPI00137CCB99|nr:hypothetical protein [Magnetospirillum sp. UT-4]CAA7625252.1 conserved exported hypothetical protein [Magnetospirillum sp. UT-4]